MKFADLFAGIGGFHYALNKVNSNEENIPVLVSEIDKYAMKAYSVNHNYDINEIRNIREYTEENERSRRLLNEVPDFELLMGGFPCQAFSNAGHKKGFMDETRGTLFFDVAKILENKKPKYILLENVKHLGMHDEGRTWNTIRDTLKEIGYLVPEEPILLSPHDYNIAQIRHRVFIPGILKDKCELNVFPKDKFQFNKSSSFDYKIEYDNPVNPATFVKDPKVLKSLEAWGEFIEKVERPYGRTLPVVWLDYMTDQFIPTEGKSDWEKKYIKDMQALYMNKHNREFIDMWMKKHKVHLWQKRERKLEWQAGKDNYDHKNAFVQLRQSGFRFKKTGVFPTLVAMVQTSIFFDKSVDKWRYLSLDEVRQLQSFPKDFKFDVPEYQTYKQFGNSVNVDIVAMVLTRLLSIK